MAEQQKPAEPSTLPENAALLRAVLADPGEDTVRLAYADWLEETGHGKAAAWAGAIRLMVQNPRILFPTAAGRGKSSRAAARVAELFRAAGPDMAAFVRDAYGFHVFDPVWHRGFVFRVRVSGNELCQPLGELSAGWGEDGPDEPSGEVLFRSLPITYLRFRHRAPLVRRPGMTAGGVVCEFRRRVGLPVVPGCVTDRVGRPVELPRKLKR